MATEQLEATRENDARVAEAMGWIWLRRSVFLTRWLGPRSEIGDQSEVFGTVRECDSNDMADCEVEVDDADSSLPHFLTDPAEVVPMMTRLGELLDRTIHLRRWKSGDWSVFWGSLYEPVGIWTAESANLALGAALLAVWAEAQP